MKPALHLVALTVALVSAVTAQQDTSAATRRLYIEERIKTTSGVPFTAIITETAFRASSQPGVERHRLAASIH
jgi:hypothetical protein